MICNEKVVGYANNGSCVSRVISKQYGLNESDSSFQTVINYFSIDNNATVVVVIFMLVIIMATNEDHENQ